MDIGRSPLTGPYGPVEVHTEDYIIYLLICEVRVRGVSVVQGSVSCQQHWHQVHAVRGLTGMHNS
jgi:hypothetical protein